MGTSKSIYSISLDFVPLATNGDCVVSHVVYTELCPLSYPNMRVCISVHVLWLALCLYRCYSQHSMLLSAGTLVRFHAWTLWASVDRWLAAVVLAKVYLTSGYSFSHMVHCSHPLYKPNNHRGYRFHCRLLGQEKCITFQESFKTRM